MCDPIYFNREPHYFNDKWRVTALFWFKPINVNVLINYPARLNIQMKRELSWNETNVALACLFEFGKLRWYIRTTEICICNVCGIRLANVIKTFIVGFFLAASLFEFVLHAKNFYFNLEPYQCAKYQCQIKISGNVDNSMPKYPVTSNGKRNNQ